MISLPKNHYVYGLKCISLDAYYCILIQVTKMLPYNCSLVNELMCRPTAYSE